MDANSASASAGKCDGCGAADVPLTKISLGRDFFGRVYDRLSPSADLSPKWYCDRCSVEKNLQRDFRDIKGELDKLSKGTASALSQADQLERAMVSVVCNIGEAYGRCTPADRRNRYSIARGEANEAGAMAGVAQLYRVFSDGDYATLRSNLLRTTWMLTALLRKS